MMNGMQRRAWSAVVAGSMLAMVACGSGGSTKTADLLTPDQATAAALAHLQKPTLSAALKDDTGSLRAYDQANLTLNPLPSPEPTIDPSITHHVTVWVAHQSSYPLSFLCLDSPTVPGGQALPTMFFFTKAAAASSWTVTYQVVLTAMANAPDVAIDSGGYAQVIPANRYSALLASPAQLGGDYSAYITAGNSADTHEFAPGPLTSQTIDANNQNIRGRAQQRGETETVSYVPSGDPVVAYLLNDGGALVLVGLRASAHLVATKAPITVSMDGKGISGPAPGKYHDITFERVVMNAFVDPPKNSTDRVAGIGANGGPIRSTGTPA